MWQSIEYKGFEIYVAPFEKDGPVTQGMLFWYNGYVCKPEDSQNNMVGKRLHFHNLDPIFPTKKSALEAGYEVGKSIIDRTHPTRSIDDLK